MGAVKACFGSCVSNTKDFFTKPTHFSRWMGEAETRDKLLKTGISLGDFGVEIAKLADASPTTIESIESGRAFVKTGRDAHAIFNIFAGVIAAFVQHMKVFFQLVASMFTKNEVRFKPESADHAKWRPTDAIPADAPGHSHLFERFFAALANFFKGLSALAYTVGFGICRTIQNLDKYFKDKQGNRLVELGEGARALGDSFQIVMAFNHIGGFVGSLSDITYRSIAFDRAMGDANFTNKRGIYADFVKKVTESIVSFIEKTLELMLDIGLFFIKWIPAWFSIPAGLAIGVCGCYKQWLKTEKAEQA